MVALIGIPKESVWPESNGHASHPTLLTYHAYSKTTNKKPGPSSSSSSSFFRSSSTSPSISLSSLERSPLLLATLLPDIVALGCHAAAASAAAAVGQEQKGDGVGLVGLQLKGVEVLRCVRCVKCSDERVPWNVRAYACIHPISLTA